ncbi:MAG: hypothetical protein E3J30_10305 [Anaerolineales bacterium]|nr:MAG: hypothetical protein E3J30_10305 [Anaerolineales bacterium]
MYHYKIGCDAHRRYSQFAILDHEGHFLQQVRVNHMPGTIRDFLEDYPPGTPVALESVGNWYWIVDEIEAAGCLPLMAHAAKAEVMMGNVNKTDKLDARGLATLLHLGSLPTVWLPPHEIRDERELHRTRIQSSCTNGGVLQTAHCPQEPRAFHSGQVCPLPGHRQRYLCPEMEAGTHESLQSPSARNAALYAAAPDCTGSCSGPDQRTRRAHQAKG